MLDHGLVSPRWKEADAPAVSIYLTGGWHS
jgi:hypothetical protein